MIANYINPEIIIPNDAVGIDAAIGDVQKLLGSKTNWIQKIFGRCTVQVEVMKQTTDRAVKTKEYVYPQVYSKTGEPLNMLMNDNLDSYCFFNVLDPGEFIDYDSLSNQQFLKRKVSIIFWMNCPKIAPGTLKPLNEELIISVVKALKNYMAFEFQDVYETYKKIFEGFTIDENLRQYMKFPYSAFRIDGEIQFPLFAENCEPVAPLPPSNGVVSNNPNEFTFTPSEQA